MFIPKVQRSLEDVRYQRFCIIWTCRMFTLLVVMTHYQRLLFLSLVNIFSLSVSSPESHHCHRLHGHQMCGQPEKTAFGPEVVHALG